MLNCLKIYFKFTQVPKNLIILFGAPGVGKGTYSKLIQQDFNLQHISSGDILRSIISGKNTAQFDPQLVNNIKSLINQGQALLLGILISDQLITKIIEDQIKQVQKPGYILDGYPRTLTQLEKIKYLKNNLVLNITLREDILIEKLMGRRSCINCGYTFNLYQIKKDGYDMQPLLPKRQNICDKCGSKLIRRKDDTHQIISDRMATYRKQTMPLLKRFEEKNILVNFEVKRGKKDYPLLKTIIQNKILN